MERADNVIKLLLEADVVCFRRHAGLRVVEHALAARASRADVSARVATNALAELALPECVTLGGGHRFQLAHTGEAVVLHLGLVVHGDNLVGDDVLFALAGHALSEQHFGALRRSFAVQRIEFYVLAVVVLARNSRYALLLELVIV